MVGWLVGFGVDGQRMGLNEVQCSLWMYIACLHIAVLLLPFMVVVLWCIRWLMVGSVVGRAIQIVVAARTVLT